MRVDLHIGFTKTGTSQFQYLMANSSKLLKKQGVYYPLSGRKYNAHHGLVNLLVHQRINTAGDPTATLSGLRREIDGQKCSRVIISSEGFMLAKDARDGLMQLSNNYDLRVYAFLRPPISWVNSMFNQVYKNILYDRPYVDESLSQYKRAERFINTGMKFNERLDTWKRLLGADRLRVCCLEQGSNFAQGIQSALNVKLASDTMGPTSKNNTSLCGDAMHYLAWLAEERKAYNHQEKVRFMNILNDYSSLSGTPVENYIPLELESETYAQAKKANRLISNAYFGGKTILAEKNPFNSYFDVSDYDESSVLRVNRYVLSRLNERVDYFRLISNKLKI